jgi:hypothetical protein
MDKYDWKQLTQKSRSFFILKIRSNFIHSYMFAVIGSNTMLWVIKKKDKFLLVRGL